MTHEERVTELTARVVRTCRRRRMMLSRTRLLDRGVEVTGLTIDEARALVAEVAGPLVETVRDGSSVVVLLKVTECPNGHGPLENGDCPDCGFAI